MTVAGRPIIDWIVLGLVGDGIRKIYVSVNHLADQIKEHARRRPRLGCRGPLPSRGPRQPARHRPVRWPSSSIGPPEPLLVMNGDLHGRLRCPRTAAIPRASAGTRSPWPSASTATPSRSASSSTDADRVHGIVEKPDLQ